MTKILGKSVATAEQMAAFLLSKNPNPKINLPVETFCRLFLYMGAIEGVRGDISFVQSCKETGYFAFNGTVKPEQNNYAGLGTTDVNTPGAYFPDEATGILAQIQHAKGYEGTDLVYDCVDPRYKVLLQCKKVGTAKHWEELGGSWAVPGYDTKKYSSLEAANDAKDSYGYQIVNLFNEMMGCNKQDESTPVRKELPLKGIKICIDAGHYAKYNRCSAIPAYYESEAMWKLHLLQKKYLEAMGATVVTTRTDASKDLALNSRGTAAKGCDLFISNHSNAVGSGMNESVDYVAVYHLVEDVSATCDDISKEIANGIAPVIAGVMNTQQGYKTLTRKSSNDRNGDGVMNDNYYGVLHGARMVDVPGLILEHSFHTNTRTVNWLLQDANLDILAKAEAEYIASYFADVEVKAEDDNDVPYYIRVSNVGAGDVLNIRKEPNVSAEKTGKLAYNDPNKYTIVEECNGWGCLKSGIGWINLHYTKRVS